MPLPALLSSLADTVVDRFPCLAGEFDETAPLWQRLLTVPNMMGLAVYFSLLLMGFWALKVLADNDGSSKCNYLGSDMF